MKLSRLIVLIVVLFLPTVCQAADEGGGSSGTPNAGGLTWIDWLIIVVYAASTLWLGWVYGRRQRTTREYFTGSGRMNPILIGVSLFATLLSTISYLSMPGEALGKGPIYLTTMLA